MTGILSCIITEFSESNTPVLYIVAILIGGGSSITMVTSLSVTAELIGPRTERSALVYSVVTFLDKVVTGLVVILIEKLWVASQWSLYYFFSKTHHNRTESDLCFYRNCTEFLFRNVIQKWERMNSRRNITNIFSVLQKMFGQGTVSDLLQRHVVNRMCLIDAPWTSGFGFGRAMSNLTWLDWLSNLTNYNKFAVLWPLISTYLLIYYASK